MYHTLRTSFCLCYLLLLTACLNEEDGRFELPITYHSSVTENIDTVTVAGIASKGLLSNADVIIYAADDGVGRNLILGSGVTNKQGEYLIQIPLAYSGPIIVQVKSDAFSKTLMACDNANGCGALDLVSAEHDSNANGLIDFGELFPLQDGFEMNAAYYVLGDTLPVTLHITPLTHLTEALAESYGDAYSKHSILKAESHVADLFGLTGRLSSIRPLDLTHLDEQQDYDLEQVRYSLFSASFAGLASNQGEFSDVVESVSGLFISNGGQFLLLDESILGVAYEDLLNASVDLLEQVGSNDDSFVQMSLLLKMELVDIRTRAKAMNITDAKPGDNLNLEALNKSKELVDELMNWQDSLALNEQAGIGFVDKTFELKTAVDNAQVATAFLAAVKYAPVLAVMPVIGSNEEVVEYICDQVGGSLGYMCRQLLSNGGMQDLGCESQANMLCNMLADTLVVPIPTLEEGLSADYSVLAQTVHVYGFAYDQDVDFLFRLKGSDLTEKISVIGEGELENELTLFSLMGSVSLDPGKGEGGFQGESELAISVSDLNGDDYTLSLRHGENAMAIAEFNHISTSGQNAKITVVSNMDDWGDKSEHVEIESQGKHLVLTKQANEEGQFYGFNQDGIGFTFDLSGSQDAELGEIVLGEKLLATIVRENAALFVDFIDGTRRDITALIL